MAPNDTNQSAPKPVPASSPAPMDPPSRRVDPRMWALLPVVALLILGAYFLGKYLNRPVETAPAQPVVQTQPVEPKGKMLVTEVPPAMRVTPVVPTTTTPAPNPNAKPPSSPAFKQEEPAVILPNATDSASSGEGTSDSGSAGGGQASSGEKPAHSAEPDRDPVKVNDPALEYPSSAYEEGVQGTARVTFTITSEGTTADASIGQSSGDNRLDQAALDYVKRLRFRPAIRDGQPVSVQATRAVPFSLQ